LLGYIGLLLAVMGRGRKPVVYHLNDLHCAVSMVCALQRQGIWYRAQIVQNFDDDDDVVIRFIDYGGYETVPLTSLKQIRFAVIDFLLFLGAISNLLWFLICHETYLVAWLNLPLN